MKGSVQTTAWRRRRPSFRVRAPRLRSPASRPDPQAPSSPQPQAAQVHACPCWWRTPSSFSLPFTASSWCPHPRSANQPAHLVAHTVADGAVPLLGLVAVGQRVHRAFARARLHVRISGQLGHGLATNGVCAGAAGGMMMLKHPRREACRRGCHWWRRAGPPCRGPRPAHRRIVAHCGCCHHAAVGCVSRLAIAAWPRRQEAHVRRRGKFLPRQLGGAQSIAAKDQVRCPPDTPPCRACL
jgi:hypothetical protein